MPEDYGPTNRELYDLILTLKEAMEFGFARVDSRMDARFAGVDARFDRVEGRLTSVEGRLGGIERWAARVDERLASIEGQNIAARFNDHERRIDKLEQRRFDPS